MSYVDEVIQKYLSKMSNTKGNLLLIKCGDFYEAFYNDAETLAAELDITLTKRRSSQFNDVPMAGIPVHASAKYIAKLEANGFNVTIMDD